MNSLIYTYARKVVTLLFLFSCFSSRLFAQQSLIKVNGWNAYVHLPWDYNVNPTATYPTIIFFPGLGEVGKTASLVIKNGPGAYITQGWNGNVKIGIDSVKFIVISLQPDKAWPTEDKIDQRIQTLKSLYRIDNSRLHLTGLSMGGWCSTTYVTGDNYGGPYKYASQIATVVEVEGVRPDDNAPYPQLFDNFAKSGGRLLGFEQINDGRDIQTRVNRMNFTKPGSGIFVSTNFGGGGHCCWEQFYGGNGATPNNFILNSINQNIYQWMARNPAPVTGPPKNIAPVANAGSNKTITLPVSSVTIAGSGTDADGNISSYSWAKISGPSPGTIVNPNLSIITINNLATGTYVYELTVTDNNGATGKDQVIITVNSPLANIPPIANAGRDIVITLPIRTTTLYGSGTDLDGAISSYSWVQVSGAKVRIRFPNSATATLARLKSVGTYTFRLTVTDNAGAIGMDYVTVTVVRNTVGRSGIIDHGNNPDSTLHSPSVVSGGDQEIKPTALTNTTKSETVLKADYILLSNNMLTVKLNSGQQQVMHLSVTDVSGRTFLKTNVSLQKGYNTFSKFIPGISKGIYYIKLFTNDNFIAKPLLNSTR